MEDSSEDRLKEYFSKTREIYARVTSEMRNLAEDGKRELSEYLLKKGEEPFHKSILNERKNMLSKIRGPLETYYEKNAQTKNFLFKLFLDGSKKVLEKVKKTEEKVSKAIERFENEPEKDAKDIIKIISVASDSLDIEELAFNYIFNMKINVKQLEHFISDDRTGYA